MLNGYTRRIVRVVDNGCDCVLRYLFVGSIDMVAPNPSNGPTRALTEVGFLFFHEKVQARDRHIHS